MKAFRSEDTLGDWGEARILDALILPTLGRDLPTASYGSDCGYADISEASTLVVTTDYAPKPAVWSCGFRSYRTWGWFAVLINASDLAAAGCKPLGFVSSIDAPPDMKVIDLWRFVSGVRGACDKMHLRPLGGNIRQGPHFACHGTAFGLGSSASKVTRHGCAPGELIYSIGPCGEFVSALLKSNRTRLTASERRTILRPTPQLAAMERLASDHLITAASDNSDGVLGAVWNILERSECGAEMDMDRPVPASISSTAKSEGLDPWNLMYCWGDWNVIVTVPECNERKMIDIMCSHSTQFEKLGRIIAGTPELIASRGKKLLPLRLLRNENFRSDSFNASLEDHLSMMLETPLV